MTKGDFPSKWESQISFPQQQSLLLKVPGPQQFLEGQRDSTTNQQDPLPPSAAPLRLVGLLCSLPCDCRAWRSGGRLKKQLRLKSFWWLSPTFKLDASPGLEKLP